MERFPRLKSSLKELERTSQLIHATYNKLAKIRNLRSGFYDVYKTKKGKFARRYFPILADRLICDRIDPSLYLKVLSKYGNFSEARFLPPPRWLASNKAREVYTWLLRKEKAKFSLDSDWRNYLVSFSADDPINLPGKISQSWGIIRDIEKAYSTTIFESILFGFNFVNPWFLAICPDFLGSNGLQLVKPKYKKVIKNCMRYLLYNRQAFMEAIRAYKKFSRV